MPKLPHQQQLDVSTNQSFLGQDYTAEEKMGEEEELESDGRMKVEEERSREDDVNRHEKTLRGEGKSMQEESDEESYSPQGQRGVRWTKENSNGERKNSTNFATLEAVVTQEKPTQDSQSQPKTKPLKASSTTDTSAVRKKPAQVKETMSEVQAKARPRSTQPVKHGSKMKVPNGTKHPEYKLSSAVPRNAGGQNPSAREPMRTRAASDTVSGSKMRELKPAPQKGASLPNDGARRPCAVKKPKNSSTTGGHNVPARVPLQGESSDLRKKEVNPRKTPPLHRTNPSTAKNPSMSGKGGAKSTPKRGSKSTPSIYIIICSICWFCW